MKKTSLMLAMVLGLLVSGCAVKKYCFVEPSLLEVRTVNPGSILVKKTECYGRLTADECMTTLELTYLGKNGGNIRVASKVIIKSTPVITEALYTENSKFIEFQDVKIEVLKVENNLLTYKLVHILTQGCSTVNGKVK
jgi:hypothetical protein